jgi:hypothetical protein
MYRTVLHNLSKDILLPLFLQYLQKISFIIVYWRGIQGHPEHFKSEFSWTSDAYITLLQIKLKNTHNVFFSSLSFRDEILLTILSNQLFLRKELRQFHVEYGWEILFLSVKN